jgi:ABC-type polysaccharide/polyol phosphate transport system ATPase subunit
LCDRALLINHGKLYEDGPPQAVIDAYHRLLAA